MSSSSMPQRAAIRLRIIRADAQIASCSIPDELPELRAAVAEMTEAAADARRPFAWEDGPLVSAMRSGAVLLVDEINLAEDAVIERLNRCLLARSSPHPLGIHTTSWSLGPADLCHCMQVGQAEEIESGSRSFCSLNVARAAWHQLC